MIHWKNRFVCEDKYGHVIFSSELQGNGCRLDSNRAAAIFLKQWKWDTVEAYYKFYDKQKHHSYLKRCITFPVPTKEVSVSWKISIIWIISYA